MNPKYRTPVRRLGGSALIITVIGILFAPLSKQIFSEDTRSSVLVNSIPFVALFIALLLLFMLLIFIVALRFNGKLPYRMYHPIERLVVSGIVLGVVFLFQPWLQIAYRYGFLLLLFSTLIFILWSHVVPQSQRLSAGVPALTTRQHVTAGVAALVLMVVMAAYLINLNRPVEPYGMRQRAWATLTEERQQQIRDDNENEFTRKNVPFLIILSLIPGTFVYLIVRELNAPESEDEHTAQQTAVMAKSG